TKMQIQASERDIPEIQVALPGSHLHAQFQREVFIEPQAPFVPRIAKTHWMRILGDSDFANAVRDVVIHARFIVGVRKPEVRVESMLRIAANGEFSSTHLQVGARGLCSLEIHGLGGVVKVRRVQTMPARHVTAVPEEQNEDNNERQNPAGSCPRAWQTSATWYYARKRKIVQPGVSDTLQQVGRKQAGTPGLPAPLRTFENHTVPAKVLGGVPKLYPLFWCGRVSSKGSTR